MWDFFKWKQWVLLGHVLFKTMLLSEDFWSIPSEPDLSNFGNISCCGTDLVKKKSNNLLWEIISQADC